MATDDPDRHLVELALECLRLARPTPLAPEAAATDSGDTQGQEEPTSDDTRSDPAG